MAYSNHYNDLILPSGTKIRLDGSSSGTTFISKVGAGAAITITTGGTAAATFSASDTTFAADITVSGGDITLGGTGRIQGVDTVSASTDAANKAYVDAREDTGVPAILSNGSTPSLNSGITALEVRNLIGAGTSSSSGVTSVATGNGISGGTITSTGTLTVGAGNGLSQSSTGLLLSGSYTGNYIITGGLTTGATININNPGSDKKISFDRTGGKGMSIEHDASSMYFYNETDAVTMFKMFNAGSATVTGDFTVNGGDITLGGTGRIQGVDTVSASTDAANKAYVDNAIPSVGNGTLTVSGGTGMSGSGTFTANQSGNTTITLNNSITNNNQLTNGAGYITSASLPSVGNGTLTMSTNTGLDGSASFTANQSGNSSFAVTLDLNELGASGTLVGTDDIVVVDGTLSKKTQISTIPLSIFFNNSGFTTNTGTVTNVSGTGSVSGLSLSGSVSTSGSLSLGGTLFLTSANVTSGLGFTPYNSSNPSGFTTFAEPGIFSGGGTPTLASGVTALEVRNLIGAGTSSSAGVTTVGATSPIASSGGTSPTISIATASGSATGALSSSDWTTFNNKTSNTGTVTSVGATAPVTSSGGTSPTIAVTTAAVNLSSSNLATGTQIQTAINTALTGVLQFEGTWNASTNSPSLSSGVGTSGDYYIVSVAGSTNLDGITDWAIGDWAVFANTTWTKIDNSSVGNVTGSGSSTRVAFWNSNSNITSDAGLTFNGGSNALTVGGTVTWSGGSSGESNSAFDNMVTGFGNSGSSSKTLTLTQQDGGTLTTSFSIPQGTVTSVGTGTGLDGTFTTSGTITLDLSELPTAGALIETDEFIVLDGNVESKKQAGQIGLSIFSNNSGFTSFAEPGIFSGGGTPTLASGVTALEIRNLIGAGTSSSAGVTGVSATSPITSSNTGSGATTIAINTANASTTGALTSTDWNTFNNKTSNTGTATSVGISHGGNAFNVGGTPVTTSGTLAISMAGNSAQYVRGDGNLASFPSIPQGTITGSGTSGRVTFWNGGTSITSDSGFTFSSSDDSVTLGKIKVGNGTVSLPSLTFSGDTDTGFYKPGAGQISLSINGTEVFGFGTAGIGVFVNSPTGPSPSTSDSSSKLATTAFVKAQFYITASSTNTLTNKSGNISQWTNNSGYTTNTGTTTASNSQTFTNKSGNISQWTNDSGYITSQGAFLPLSGGTMSGNIDMGDNNIRFNSTSGGAGDGILYKDSAGTFRTALTFEATNKVVLSNRASNGEIELRANTSVVGTSGEVTVATIKDTGIITFKPIGLDVSLANNDANGFTLFTGASSVTGGKIYYWTGSGWTLASASNAYNRLIAMARGTGTSGAVGMVVQGLVNGAQSVTSNGLAAYLTTSGNITTTTPTSGYARIVGYAYSSSVFYFDPDKTWVVIANP